jgi:integrase
MALTVKRIAKLTSRRRYLDSDGLYLQVLSPSNRSWLLRYEFRGKKRWMGLGSLATFSLEEARARARKARQLLADGIDPLEVRKAERNRQILEAARNKTFATVAQEYYETHEASWSNRKHRQQFLNTLRDYAFPILGALPVADIDEPVILSVLRPIWATKTITAKRVRNRIASVLDFAAAAKYRTGTNPARWEGHLEHLLAAPDKIAAVNHLAALPYTEIAAFLSELRELPGVPARALEFAILTAARTNEVIGARWSEIENSTWIISAARMKSEREHRVPLSTRALNLLSALPREGEFIFVGPKAGTAIGALAMLRVLRRLRSDVTVHGFRSTFRDWAAEQTAFANHVVEMALAHAIGDKVEAAYRRGDLLDRRRQLMEQWASYCAQPQRAGEVVSLRGVS